MPSLPLARQSYNPNLKPAMRVVRTAVCPLHDKKSSEFAGAEDHSWVFRCSAANVKGAARADHYFAARPDPSAPRTAEEMQPWVQAQLLARASSVSESRTGAR